MPTKPPRQKVAGQRPPDQVRRAQDRRRNSQQWRHGYWTAAWRKKAKAQLDAEPLCAYCLRAGRITPATVADHVVPHRGDHDLFWNGELQSLCDEAPWRCHSRIKQKEEREC